MAAPYKEVLDAQCSPAMQAAYDGIGPEARSLLLESLRSVCEGRLVAALRAACADADSRTLDNLAAAPSSSGGDSPVVRAFRATCGSPLARLHPPAEAVRELEGFLRAGWGVRRGVEAVLAEGEEVRRRIAELEGGGGGGGGAVAVKASDSTVRKSTGGGGLSVAALRRLRRVGVRELVPFTTMRGARFEGVILAPPAGMVGLQVVVRDRAGDHLELGLYNQMERPDAALAAKLFPVGATLCVVEPFLKVFRSGAVGVRVDSSAEVLVYPEDWREAGDGEEAVAEEGASSALGAALRRAVGLTEDARATFEAFVKALHVAGGGGGGGGGEAAALGTVLSNAAQGYLCMGRHGEAAAAAAAALFVAPTDPAAAGESKALHRYGKAMAAIEDGDGGFECLLELGKVGVRGGAAAAAAASGASGLEARKAEGNALFKKGAHEAAVAAYLAGVRETPWVADLAAACAQFCRACARLRLRDHVLAAWGVVACAAAAGVDGAAALLRDVSVEAAAACVAMGDTAVLAPGLVALCDDAAAAAALRRLAKVATPPARGAHPFSAAALRYNEAAEAMEVQAGAALGSRVSALAALPQWTGPLSVRNVRGRGRGVFAAAAVAAGDVLMVDGAVVRHAADAAAEGELTVTTSTADAKASDSAMVRAYTSLYFRQLHDRYCRRATLFLHDGEDEHGYNRDVLQPADCLDHLFAAPLPAAGDKPRSRTLHRANRARPLLCFERGTPQEAAAADAVTQTRLQRILRLNGFGSGDGGSGTRTLGLYPAISMLNHSLENNASLVPAKWEGGGEEVGLLLIAVRNIAAGEEVTIQYSNDPALLKEKWGIVEG